MAADEQKRALIEGVADLRERSGAQCSLCAIGLKREDIPVLAKNAIDDPCVATNPIQPNVKDIEAVYEKAYKA